MISISIIIPVYNVEPYVKRCLESVMAQDQVGADLECIIVDDCGQDHSMEIVRQAIAAYQGPIRFQIAEHGKNRGLSAARNTGLEKATGSYVMFIDSDDYLMPDSISYFLEQQQSHPDVDMLMGNVRNCKGDNLLIQHLQEPLLLNDPNVFFANMLHHRIYLYAWNKLIRKAVLTDCNILFEEGTIYEDQLWSYLLFSRISSLLLLPRVTYVYENNPSSIVNTTFTQERADKALWSYTVSCNKMLDNPPAPEKYQRNMTVDYLLFMTNFLMNGVDLASRCPVSASTAMGFRAVRQRLLARSIRYGRLLLSGFFLLLFPPMSCLQKWRFFRRHYYDIESAVNYLAHLTDFLHRKERI